MISLTPERWEPILERIKSEYPVSVWAVSWRTREVLGFTVRRGEGWTKKASIAAPGSRILNWKNGSTWTFGMMPKKLFSV